MAKKERKAAVDAREGALNNGAMRCMAELGEIALEFGDGRDLEGVASICPTHRAPDDGTVNFETPESLLIAREDLSPVARLVPRSLARPAKPWRSWGEVGRAKGEAEQEEVYEESETEEEPEKIDVGTCVRVDGLLLCDHLMLEARAEREQDMIKGFCATFANKLAADLSPVARRAKGEEVEVSRRMVVNALVEFERDDRTKIGMRLDASMHNADHFKDLERPPGHSPFKERRLLARSRRNQQTRERILRASERKSEEMWILNEEYYAALERELVEDYDYDWDEYYESEYERDLELANEEARQEELLAFAIEGKDERELEFYGCLEPDDDWDEAAYEELEAAYEGHDRQEDLINNLYDLEAAQAEEEERAERKELETLERRWRGYFTNGAKAGDVPEDRVMAYNQAAIVRSIEEFERYGTTKSGMRISSRRWFKKNGDEFCTGNRPFKERPCGIARSRRLMAAEQMIEAIFEKSNEDEIANA